MRSGGGSVRLTDATARVISAICLAEIGACLAVDEGELSCGYAGRMIAQIYSDGFFKKLLPTTQQSAMDAHVLSVSQSDEDPSVSLVAI